MDDRANVAGRPESVNVTAWVVLVFCAFGYLGCLMIWSFRDIPQMMQMYARMHISPANYSALLIIHVTIDALCAVGFLFRVGWARHVYAASGTAMVVYAFWTSPYPLFAIPSALYVVGVTTVLFLPKNNQWFAGRTA